MRKLRVLVPAALVMLTSVTFVVPATAQDSDRPAPREYGESGVSTGSVTVRARSGWLPRGAAGSGGGSSSCSNLNVEVIVEDDFVQPVNREWRRFSSGEIPFTATNTDLPSSLPTFMRHFSPTGRWLAVTCDGVITVVPEGGPAVNVAALVQEALDEVDPSEPELAMTPEDVHYTQLQSWLAVDPAYWDADRQGTASAGRVLVTATVTPFEANWDMGDGESVTCDGPGTVWEPGLDDAASTCSYTYRSSSAGAPDDSFEVVATVNFDVEVTTNAPGNYGPFPDLERETVADIQVGEIQAVND